MGDDVSKVIYGVLVAFIVVITAWIGYVFIVGCGFSLDCKSYYAPPERTPIPTLIPARLPLPAAGGTGQKLEKCQVTAKTLLGAWVSSGYPETDPFSFTDAQGMECTATFYDDVQQLFLEANLWYSGAIACATCHQADINKATARMDLSSYDGILAGSRRASADVAGNDVLGGGVWEESKLYEQLFVVFKMPFGRPPDAPPDGPLVFAGQP
jgi:hypothetical protein